MGCISERAIHTKLLVKADKKIEELEWENQVINERLVVAEDFLKELDAYFCFRSEIPNDQKNEIQKDLRKILSTIRGEDKDD